MYDCLIPSRLCIIRIYSTPLPSGYFATRRVQRARPAGQPASQFDNLGRQPLELLLGLRRGGEGSDGIPELHCA